MLGSGLSAGKLFPLFSPFVLYTTLVRLRAEVKKTVATVRAIMNLTREGAPGNRANLERS